MLHSISAFDGNCAAFPRDLCWPGYRLVCGNVSNRHIHTETDIELAGGQFFMSSAVGETMYAVFYGRRVQRFVAS